MEYLLDIKFEDNNYNAIIYFVTTLTASSEAEAKLFLDELIAGFERRKIVVLHATYRRIDNNPELRERQYEYYNFCLSRATANIKIEQFLFESPDQTKSLVENLTERLLSGKDSTARIGNQFNIPVRVTEKGTRNPIAGEIFFCNIEQLIPEN